MVKKDGKKFNINTNGKEVIGDDNKSIYILLEKRCLILPRPSEYLLPHLYSMHMDLKLFL